MPESLVRAQQMTGGSLIFETVDIRNREEIRKVFEKVKTDKNENENDKQINIC